MRTDSWTETTPFRSPRRLVVGVGLALALGALGAPMPARAYEIGTHAWMTNEAYLRSDLAQTGPTSLRTRLGFDRLTPGASFDSLIDGATDTDCLDITSGSNPLHCYYDNLATDTNYFYRRPSYSPYEDEVLVSLARAGQLRDADGAVVAGSFTADPTPSDIQNVAFGFGGWLMRGAIREDDLALEWSSGHDNDPRGNIFRVFNHFWDPIHDLDMSVVSPGGVCPPVFPGQVCNTALKWAMGQQDPLSPAPSEDTARRQHFSYRDAVNNYWWALTRQRSKEADHSGTAVDDSRERMFRWATTLRSLGDVVHLLQDMAQPLHTRLDPHSPVQPARRQLFEPFTEARVMKLGSARLPEDSVLRSVFNAIPDPTQIPPPPVGCYPTMAFTTPRQFYSNQSLGDTVAVRMGLADYSNRGFFTQGTLPNNTSGGPTYDNPPPFLDGSGTLINGYETVDGLTHLNLLQNGNAGAVAVHTTLLLHDVPDAVSHSGCSDVLPAAYHGKVPLAAENLFERFGNLSSVPAPGEEHYTVEPESYTQMANLLIPRAVGYTTGMMNFFFRGQLTVVAPSDSIMGVVNQGIPHLSGGGYPIQTSGPNAGKVLGFESVRLKVRNSTVPITPTSGGAAVPQNTGGAGSKLVAVARYHRNTCYKPDMSGERVQSYAAPPLLTITEPACAAGEVVRTSYQEISVSAPLTVAAGELDVAAGAEVEKKFDFSNDPIPVNATDLFIQVAYRGTLGAEADAVAVGMMDVQEPTFAAFWNNTDYFWNGSNWLGQNGTYPNTPITDFSVCSGGAPVKLVFQYTGGAGTPAMSYPSGSSASGVVRLAMLFPPRAFPNQRFSVRGTPFTTTTPHVLTRSNPTAGAYHQANRERVAPATLAAPVATCVTALPATSEYWCYDTVQRRRSQTFGAPAQPFYLSTVGDPPYSDVDAQPLPAIGSIAVLQSGTLRFNTDATLAACPGGQTLSIDEIQHLQEIELLEEARSVGASND